MREAQAEANQAIAQSEDAKEQLDLSVVEITTLACQKQQLNDQIECMQKVIDQEFAGLDPDIQKARKEVALLRDMLIAKEEAAAKAKSAPQ